MPPELPNPTKPTVSVILPCFNAHTHLPRTLASLTAQTYRDFDITIVDDGSDDPATRAYLDGLASEINVIRQPNQGLPAARNTGFRHAAGRLVLPLDCDDQLAPTFLERTVAALDGHGDNAFAFTHVRMTGEQAGDLVKHFNPFEQLYFNQLPYCLLIPRVLWQQVDGYDDTMRSGYEDWEFNIRLAAAGATGQEVPAPLFLYTVSADGMLAAISRRRHAHLWRAIRAKHPTLYTRSALWQAWRRCRGRPSTRALAWYFGWEVAYRLLPAGALNWLFSAMMGMSHSRRTARQVTRTVA